VIRVHLMHCLEAHHGDLSTAIVQPGEDLRLLREITRLTERYRM